LYKEPRRKHGKVFSVELAEFLICCSSRHSEQMSQRAQLDPMILVHIAFLAEDILTASETKI